MPEERWEWFVFVLGAAIAGLLVALIVIDRTPRTPASRPAVATLSTTTTTAGRTTTRAAPIPTTTALTSTRAAAPPPAVKLRLTARADTWLSVRRSRSGRVLYQGTLAAGASRTFSGERFEVRFGAAANVQARLNGKPLPLPGGTYSVVVGASGLGPRSA